jgi:hypothetical protein
MSSDKELIKVSYSQVWVYMPVISASQVKAG